MNIGKEIVEKLEKHCGKLSNVKGATYQNLLLIKSGKSKTTLKTLESVFKENDVQAKICFWSNVDGKRVYTELEF